METLRADTDDSQINGEPIARPHLPHKMGVVFEIHRPGLALPVVGVAEPYGQIKCVTGVIEHGDKMPDVHMLVAVCPFGARDCFETGRSEFQNLF